MKDPLETFELLLEAGKIEEAKAMLGELAARELTEEEEGGAKALLTRLYVRISAEANEAYRKTLEDSIKQLKEINSKEKAMIDKLKLTQARSGLAK